MHANHIGFIGAGHMGGPMIKNLLRAGFSLRVYDKNPAALDALDERVARGTSPADVAEPGGIVLSMVSTDDELREIVLAGVLTRLGTGGIHVSLSTVSPEITEELTALYASQGGFYVAATVSGRPDVAAAGQLSLFLAGAKAAKERVSPLVQVLGNAERTYDLGEKPVAAVATKIAMNYPIPLAILAMAGAAAIAEVNGVPRQQFLEMFLQSPLFAGTVYQEYGRMIATNQYQPALFPVQSGIKDVTLMRKAAQDGHVLLLPADLYLSYLRIAQTQGWGNEDWAVAARVILQEAGLPF